MNDPGPQGVSPDLPPIPQFPQLQKKGWGHVKYPAEELTLFVGADCWAVFVDHGDGKTITPLYNTYALWDAIGHSFNKGMIPNKQYDFEQTVRDRITDNPVHYLEALKPNESLWVLLGGNIFRYIVFTRTGDGKSWKMDDYYEKPQARM